MTSTGVHTATSGAWMGLCAVLVFLLTGSLHGQSVLLTGTVRDMNSYRPIPDVNISVDGSAFGTSTDVSGAFTLRLEDIPDDRTLQFRHIAYETRRVPLHELKAGRDILLQPRIIPLQSTEIRGDRREGSAARELPLQMETIEARDFEVRGYVDAGDLLRTDHSVQVDEEISGRKAVSIRGGNADEVIVLYDGIRLNSSYSNSFDFSLVDLADIERIEIIKGSNTVLFGSEAFSGVINIVPKQQRDYTVRATQQIGSYDAGTWGVQLYRRFGALTGNYSVRNGASARAYDDMPEFLLTNSSLHHSANIGWTFSDTREEDMLRAHWRYASVQYENARDLESLDDRDHVAGLQYSGQIAGIPDITLAASWNNLAENLVLRSRRYALTRSVDEDALQLHLEKGLRSGLFDLRFSYQFSFADMDLADLRQDMRMQPVGVERARLQRERHGFVGIGKMHGETGSDFFTSFDVDLSLRQDFVRDARVDATLRAATMEEGLFEDHAWDHTLFKFAVNLNGIKDDFLLDVFLTYGNNVKYATLMQQISTPALLRDDVPLRSLEAETNRSVELGASLTREIRGRAITGWEITGSFFQNNYANKFRPITTPGLPITLFDNVSDAQISGFEGSAGVYFFGKKVLAEIGLSRYFISERSAFPFKSENKRTLSLKLDHAGYSLQIFHFSESEQVGLLREADGGWDEVELPAFQNLDVHASKHFMLAGARLFVNFSLRNILDSDDVVLSGLAIRDRRYYVTAGFQF
ncbi:MAG: TonB-dependent receptor plug domain-containing protein [Bacteroidota bacterium]|nr:TonB-dependent receptor plug domain-containing protein [Bacteroidota bacterium]